MPYRRIEGVTGKVEELAPLKISVAKKVTREVRSDMERNVQEVMQDAKAPGRPDHANRKGGSRMIVVDCCGEIAADLCKLLKSWRGRRDSNSRPLP